MFRYLKIPIFKFSEWQNANIVLYAVYLAKAFAKKSI